METPTPNQTNDPLKSEALKFLDRDFNQCFQQMRHYDGQIIDLLKFMFTGYTALVGIALGLYQFGVKEKLNLTLPAIAALSIGLILGLFMFALVVRNRAYFVRVSRYINEQRGFFLKDNPFGFENKSGMYVDPSLPLYFNWWSSHSWLLYVICLLNAILFGALLYIALTAPCLWLCVIGGAIVIYILQLIAAITYLKSKQNKAGV